MSHEDAELIVRSEPHKSVPYTTLWEITGRDEERVKAQALRLEFADGVGEAVWVAPKRVWIDGVSYWRIHGYTVEEAA